MTPPSTRDGYLHTIWRRRVTDPDSLTLIATFVGDADWYRHGDTPETAAERYLIDCYRPGPAWTPGRYLVEVVKVCDRREVVTIERTLPGGVAVTHRSARRDTTGAGCRPSGNEAE